MRDIRSLLLMLLSVGLVGTWVYHLYDKSIYSQHNAEMSLKDSASIAKSIRDSLEKNYSQTIHQLDSRLDSTTNSVDSTKSQLSSRLAEINKLRDEIGNILKNRNASKADLSVARKKITELQDKVSELQGENTSIDEERKQLNTSLEKVSAEVKNLEQNIQLLGNENKDLNEKLKLASNFIASEIKFLPVSTSGSKEQETKQVRKTDKFVISFTVQNNISEYNNAEVFVVITEPDGKVLRNSVWDSGTFETRNGVKKDYTIRLRFDYTKGEQKQQLFTLDADIIQKGNYTMQLWQNGYMIGQASRKLN